MTDIELKQLVRDIPDFPKEGILFKDITTLISDASGLKSAISKMAAPFKDQQVDYVVGTEARGFIFGPAIALELGAGFVPVRKPNKLPGKTIQAEYDLEYGTDKLEIHDGAIAEGSKVLLVDDLLATGGTIGATKDLVEQCKAEVIGISFLIELTFLDGRKNINDIPVYSVIKYD